MEWQVILWNEEENGQTDSSIGLGKITEQKGILGPGPAELRFPEAIWCDRVDIGWKFEGSRQKRRDLLALNYYILRFVVQWI